MSVDLITGNQNNHAQALMAEVKLDLKGFGALEALSLLDKTIKDCVRTATPTLYVYFDPARPGAAAANLFQPVAKRLRAAKQDGIVAHCTPVMYDTSGGFLVVFRR